MSQAIDTEEIKRLLDERNKTGGGNSSGGDDWMWVDMPEDTTAITLRFLPPYVGAKVPGKIVKTHWSMPGDEGNKGKRLCYETHNLECPIDEVLKKFEGRMNLEDYEASEKAYFNVLVRDNSAYKPDQVCIMGGSAYTLYWLLEKIISPATGDITDPVEGHDVIFKRKKHKGAWEREIVIKPTPIADTKEGIEAILNSMHNLDKIWRVPDDEYNIETVKMAKELGIILEDKINLLTNSNESSPPSTPSSDPNKVDDKKSEGKKEETSTVSESKAPAGAPECFGKELDENSKKCLACPHEFQCSEGMVKV